MQLTRHASTRRELRKEHGTFLGLNFASKSLVETAETVRALSRSTYWSYVATPNAAHLVRIASGGPEFAHLYHSATLLLFDSRFVSFAARALGLQTPPVLTGSDLTKMLFARIIVPKTPLCIIGSSSESVQQLRARYRLKRIAHYCPPIGFIKDAAEVAKVVEFVAAAQADYTFLAVGSPQQEILAHLLGGRGARGVGLCIGASLEFLSGKLRRAPRWMQGLGLEWLFRFVCEPRRLFHRYFIECVKIFGILLRARFGSK